MIKTDPIMDQDILIGQYTLGLLTSSDSERVQALLGTDASAARRALQWEEELLTLVDALPLTPPPHTLLEQILNTLDLPFPPPSETRATGLHQAQPVDVASQPRPEAQDYNKATPDQRPVTSAERSTQKREQTPTFRHMAAEPEPVTTAPALNSQPTTADLRPGNVHSPDRKDPSVTPRTSDGTHTGTSTTSPHPLTAGKRPSKKVWMGGAAVTLTVVALLALVFLPRSPVEPPVVIVEVAPSKGAILQAPGQSSTPGWVVTIDLGGNVTLTPQVHTEIPVDASVQLWTYNKILPQPRSLGLIDPNQPVAVPSELMGEIGDGQFFEMTLEAQGGSPTSEPAGPILFIGQIVTFSQ